MRSGPRGFPTFGEGILVALILVVFQLAAGIVLAFGTMAFKEKHQVTAELFAGLFAACVSALLVLNWASGERREPLRLLVVPKPLAPAPLVLVGPVSEELIWRGVVLRGFLENYRAWVAILLSSLLFAFIHLNPWQGVSGFFIGCLFAWFVARTGSLLPAITGHVVSNGLGVVAMRLDARIPGITTEGFLPWWLPALGVLVTAGGIVAFHRATRAALNASPKELVASADRTHEPP